MATANNWGLRQLDYTGAYLNGVLDRPIYLIHPLGKADENGRPVYLECRKTIYGLEQSGFCWAKLLHNYLTEAGFKRLNADSCMFRLKTTRGTLDPTSKPMDFDDEVELIVESYVDDLCYAGNSDWILNWFHDFIAKKIYSKTIRNRTAGMDSGCKSTPEHGRGYDQYRSRDCYQIHTNDLQRS